jgi:hypothetical protein
MGSRQNYLRIVDPADNTLYDRKELIGAALDTIQLTATDGESIPVDEQLVWASGDQQIGVALSGQVQDGGSPVAERLVDTSMQLALEGATRPAWDAMHLPDATVGHHALSVTAGNKPAANLDVEVVAGADAIAPLDPAPSTVVVGSSQVVCFAARNNGRFVVGLDWTYTTDNGTLGNDLRNCVDAIPAHAGAVNIQATAGGAHTTGTLTAGASARIVDGHAPYAPTRAPLRPTAGDRAAIAQ